MLGIYNMKGKGRYARQCQVISETTDVVEIAYISEGKVVTRRMTRQAFNEQMLSFTGITDRTISELRNAEHERAATA